MKQEKLLVAEFDSPAALLKAAESLKKAGYSDFETYSPFPIHGMDKAMGLSPTKLPWISLVGGLMGLFGGFFLQVWVSEIAYPLIISGKPLGSYPAFIPVTFELTILLTAFATVFGMFGLNKLPTLYRLIFNHSSFEKVTSHGFFVSVDATDPKYNDTETHSLLEKLGGKEIEVLHEK